MARLNTSNHRVVKMIGTKDFTLEVLESPTGSFSVTIETQEVRKITVPLRDLSVAFSVFDTLYESFTGRH